MNFQFSDEQMLLRGSVAGYLQRHYSFEERRKSLANGGFRPEIWRGFAEELGILGAVFPEKLGGAGGGAVETMLIMEEFGRFLVLEPYLESVVLAGCLLRQAGGERSRAMIEATIVGNARVAPSLGETGSRYRLATVATSAKSEKKGWRIKGSKTVVAGGALATHFLFSARTGGAVQDRDGISLFLAERAEGGMQIRDYALIDGRWASDVTFDDVLLGPDALIGVPGGALSLIERAVDEATSALCAEAVGVMQAMLDVTVDYAKQREQFGKPIGSFQVIQHRLADMLITIEKAKSITLMATLSLDAGGTDRPKAVSAAKAFIANAAKTVAQAAVQIHGGIGIAEETPISHYFKRATVIEGQFGSAIHHLCAYADATEYVGPRLRRH